MSPRVCICISNTDILLAYVDALITKGIDNTLKGLGNTGVTRTRPPFG